MKKSILFLVFFIFTLSLFSQVFPSPENVQVNQYTGLLTWQPPGGILYSDDFESYNIGEYLAVQSDNWTTWSNNPGSAEDALISDDYALSGTNSVKVEGSTDLLLIMENYTLGCYSMELNMYIPSGNCGYFNLQKTNIPGTEWAMQIMFDVTGEASVDAGGNSACLFPFNFNEWINIEVIADLDNDLGELWIDGVYLHTWNWTCGCFGQGTLLSLGGMNMYAWASAGNNPLYYFDDVTFKHVNAEPSEELVGYNVYLDDMITPVAFTTNHEYLLIDLIYYQQYTAGVSAIYDDPGESDIVEVNFIFTPTEILPPENLVVTVFDYNDVLLEWEQPGGTGGLLSYHNGYDNNGIGTGVAADWICAARFTADELADFYGSELITVKIHIRSADFTYVAIKVWEGGSFGDPGTEIYSADITGSVIISGWTYHTLTTPVPLIAGNEYWIGYDISATGDHPSSVDAGPAVAEKGDWMYFNGFWQEISIAFGLDYNWCIEGWVSGISEILNNKPVVQKTRQMKSNGTPEIAFTHPGKRKIENNRDNRTLLGYMVYKDGFQIAQILDPGITVYEDNGLNDGPHIYYVTALYDEGESEPSNIVEVIVILYPPLNFQFNGNFFGWEPPGPSGEYYELIEHDNSPANAYIQNFDFGYGVVFDVSGYYNVTLEMLDFRHSSFGVFGNWDYKIHIVDWNTLIELAFVESLQTTGDDQWEEGISLGSEPAPDLVGVFLEPLGNIPDNAYPRLDGDGNTDNASYYGDLENYADFTLSNVGDFLMDLWIMGSPMSEMTKAQKVNTDFDRTLHRLKPTVAETESNIYSQALGSRDLDHYNLYRDGWLLYSINSTFILIGSPISGEYCVTAVYDGDWESIPSNTVEIFLGTIVLQPGAEGKDTYICDSQPNTNNPNGPITHLLQGRDGAYYNRLLIEWDISSLPEDITINSAIMKLNCNTVYGSLSGEMAYYFILEDWDETGVTYNTQPAYFPDDPVIVDWPASNQWLEVDITDFAQLWYADSTSNHGIYGHCRNTTGTCFAEFNSSNHSNSEVRPKLTINYTAVSEIEPESEVQSINNILLYNYPNPFNPSTTIYFETTNLHENSRIEIFNIKGQKIRQYSIFNIQSSIIWDGRDENNLPVGSGVYFYQLRIDGNSKAINKMILMK